MQAIQFIQTTPEQLNSEITDQIKFELQAFLQNYKPIQPNDYLTRSEVAELLKVDLSTVHNWCKAKKLNPLGIGNRVYFLRSEVEASLRPINKL